MLDTTFTVEMLIKVLLIFAVIYFFIPSRLIKFDEENKSFLDKFFISLVHSNFIMIIAVHLLAFIKIYETISIGVSYILICIIVIVLRNRHENFMQHRIKVKITINVLDLFEDKKKYMRKNLDRLRSWYLKLKTSVNQSLKKPIPQKVGIFTVIVILGSAVYIRFHHSIIHAYLGASDSYVHLAWVKYLNANNIYAPEIAKYDAVSAGIYPYGYHAIISGLSKIFSIDPYLILRFLGPAAGFLMVLSIYYFTQKSFKNRIVSIAAILIYVFYSGLPNDFWRQISGLPQEYAAIFFLPGMLFLNTYFGNGKKIYLILASESLALTLLIHPYVAAILGIGYMIIFIINIYKVLNIRRVLYIAGSMTAAVIIGISPLITGALMGIKFNGSYGYVQQVANISKPETFLTKLLSFNEQNTSLLKVLVCVLILFVFCIVALFKKNRKVFYNNIKLNLILSITALILYVLYRAEYLGLPIIMDVNRLGIFLAMIAVIVIATTINFLDLFIANIKYNYFLKTVALLLMVFFVFNNFRFAVPEGNKFEYDESVNAYLKISRDFPKFNWTIISPVEQYSEVLGYGWHTELWEFVKVLTETKGKMVIPTDYVFLFVEKYPLGTFKPVTREDAKKKFVEISGKAAGYYINLESRTILEAKAYFWAEDYMKTHKNMEVFFDSPKVKIYLIRQDGSKNINLLDKKGD